MNPGCGWIAEYDQIRAAMDECLVWLLKIAQEPAESQTEAFLAVLGAADQLPPHIRSGIVAAAVTRLAWETHP